MSILWLDDGKEYYKPDNHTWYRRRRSDRWFRLAFWSTVIVICLEIWRWGTVIFSRLMGCGE